MTLEEIAKLAGVSKTTASYVINGKAKKYRISEKTQQKVMAVVDEHKFRPDHAASSLRAGSSRSFGLIIPDLENASYARLAKLLEQNSRQAGYQILIGCSDDDPKTEQALAEALVSRRIDALFVATSMPDANEYYQLLLQKGTPVIALDRPLDDEVFSCVVSEDFEAALQLTKSILSSDVKSVGLIGALPNLPVSRDRQLGLEAAIKNKGIDLKLAYGDHFSADEGRRLVQEWVAFDCLPDAIVCTSYTLLEGVLDVVLPDAELVQRIHIGTFGDNRLLDFIPLKVNTMAQRFEEIADSALALALNASAKRYEPGVEFIERALKVRAKRL
ncbi:catabolite repressor/activator [Vibrio breoganii]|uniref:catabolite repressor/activator n=1 Tax=Vibrio breoganii TaxID=553239 RepID=UPI0002D2DDD3|nr:catabolite repressor/activator [Vibrio breoganii]MDN3715846.1 catabolite repressor/activator [Vibrio breoganii]OED90363.1 DNA-binding transcriptional regulator FruR [Vibrio breoganii ZF-55]OED97277.1 DNA-binding transcriptional regulator FruR [Vibrio breoganii ZF-29]PMK26224.1 DNA-binding transcriptional regulator FruR [Vibrio breoganii]PMM46240.1 DNA-binding transcriptional regulator FruR [Vibrio breoganii]